jgi:D-alanyl-D-alanine carboxypeptidase
MMLHSARRCIAVCTFACALIATTYASDTRSSASQSSSEVSSALVARISSQDTVQREIDAVRTTYDIPAMTVAVWQNDQQIVHITRGLRAADSTSQATNDDLWHLGSCGKVMTAVVILRLVDRGVLQLDSPIVNSLPAALQTLMHPSLKRVTLAQLLSHTSGIYDENDWRNILKGKVALRFPQIQDGAERELWQAVSLAIERKPEHPPGEVFQYSNLGYMLAGFVAAQVAKTPWQQLVRNELFQPLGLTTAIFGLPGKVSSVEQPQGHEHTFKWLVIPITRAITPTAQNADPAYYGAAGLVSMSIQDWSAFLRMVLAGHQYQSNFLSAKSFTRLLTPVMSKNFSEYGFGVRITKGREGKGVLLDHTGSNGYWRAHFQIDTERNRIVLMAANLGAENVDKAFADVMKTINRASEPRAIARQRTGR